MDDAPLDVSVVLVSWNTRDLTTACLATLPEALGTLRADVWVIDNASSDDTVAAVRTRYPAVKLIVNDRNAGYAAAANQGINASTGRYLLLLNSDTLAQPGAIERLVHFADARPQAAVVGPMLVNPDGSFQGSFADFPSLWSELLSVTGLGKRLFFRDYPGHGPDHARTARRVDCTAGAAMLVRRTALARIGLLDEAYFMYSEETDLCLRMARAGGEVWFTPEARFLHYLGQSTRQVRVAMLRALYRSKVRFFRKHHGPLPAMALQTLCLMVLRARWVLARLQALGDGAVQIDPPVRWRDLQSLDRRPGALEG
jgi:N-acetylglucosaminyl-diphospho-decaprenol L-rhamnosyltransferase